MQSLLQQDQRGASAWLATLGGRPLRGLVHELSSHASARAAALQERSTELTARRRRRARAIFELEEGAKALGSAGFGRFGSMFKAFSMLFD